MKILTALRALRVFVGLPPEKRSRLTEIILSRVGLHGVPFTFTEDGLCTIHNSDFKNDIRFKRSYQQGFKTNSWRGWDLRWRAYFLCSFAELSSRLEGDFVECGVNLGGNAKMLVDFLPFKILQKRFYLFDTFAGFDERLLSEHERTKVATQYDYSSCFNRVKKTFRNYRVVSIIKGSVPSTLKYTDVKRVCFLSIDMNCVKPEISAFRFFWPRLSPGGVVILDDYGFKDHRRQKEAFDSLSKALNFKIIQLPTGQGLIIKPCVPPIK